MPVQGCTLPFPLPLHQRHIRRILTLIALWTKQIFPFTSKQSAHQVIMTNFFCRKISQPLTVSHNCSAFSIGHASVCVRCCLTDGGALSRGNVLWPRDTGPVANYFPCIAH